MSEHELWNELGNLYYLSGAYNQAVYAYNRSIQMESRFGRPYSNLALAYVQQGKYSEALKLYKSGIELLTDDKERAISWYRLGDVYRCLKNYRDAILAYQQGDLIDPTLSQDSKELGEVLYGPSDINSVPELSQVVAAEESSMDVTVSASDFPEAEVPSLDSVTLPAIQTVESEAVVGGEIAPVLDESRTDSLAEVSDVSKEFVETSSDESQPPPPSDDELFPVSFEQEPVEELEEQEPGEWLSYFGSDNLESTVTHIDSDAFSGPELAPVDPVPKPVRQDSTGYSLVHSRESQLETMVCTDFQNVIAVENEETLPPIESAHEGSPPEPEVVTTVEVDEQELVELVSELPEDIETEIEKIKQVLETDPSNAATWQTLGDLQKSAKMYKDAIHAYQQAVSNDPKNIDYLHRLGISYAIEGRIEDAVKTFQEVIKLCPDHALAHATLGGYYRKMGFEDLAEKHIKIAMKNIYESENEYNRACLQALCGNVDDALSLLQVALENKQTFVDWVLRDPDLDGIRFDPRFKQLISDFS